MSPIERRSEFVIVRLGFNPLTENACQGLRQDGSRCNIFIPERTRQLAMYKLGQCAHLFSDSEELRDMLLAIADDHYCELHVGSTRLVDEWILKWKLQEKVDREIHDVVQKHIADHGAIDRKWQIAFENSVYRVLKTGLAPSEKLLIIKDMTEANQRKYHVSIGPNDNAGNHGIAAYVTSDERMQPQHPSESEQGEFSMHLRTLSCPSSQATAETTGLLSGKGGTTARRSIRRRSTWSAVGNAIMKAVASPFSSSITSPTALRVTFPRVDRATTVTVEETFVPVQASTGGPECVLRPMLTFGTEFGTEFGTGSASIVQRDPPLRPVLTPPTSTSMMPLNTASSHSSFFTNAIETSTSLSIETQLAREHVECGVCYTNFSPISPTEAWKCPECESSLHIPCFQAWNMANYSQRKQTPCPYCRTIITNPTTVQ